MENEAYTYALVEDGIVTNLIMWDGISPYETNGTLVKVEEGMIINVGDNYQHPMIALDL